MPHVHTCRKPMLVSDPHGSCLGEEHQTEQCKICKAFKRRTKKERNFRWKQLLGEATLQPPGLELPTSAPASLVRSVLELSGDLAPAKHRKLSAPECQTRPQHRSSSPVRSTAQPKGRRGRSPHRRPAPSKALSTDKSGKAAVPALASVASAPQVPPSPGPSELSVDDGLEDLMDQPSTPGTFEAAKDLTELSATSPLPYRENPPAPMPRVPSRVTRSSEGSCGTGTESARGSNGRGMTLSSTNYRPAPGGVETALARGLPQMPVLVHIPVPGILVPVSLPFCFEPLVDLPPAQIVGTAVAFAVGVATVRRRLRPLQLLAPCSGQQGPSDEVAPQWGPPGHWPFWTPWPYQQSQRALSTASYSVQRSWSPH
ncbi:hypothetical protein UY3_06530 [Chelonia mydas]|uniref:Uncharacterized protein n=1 Tax=Chelonia mydas TaxID=8469 RepID=M7BKS9_CHEMY|nr:hypothetical protein UY3_06530 [Chelonia mydas]